MKVSDFFDPTKQINYYSVFWWVIFLLSIGTLVAFAAIQDTGVKALVVIALSCGAILFGALGIVARFFYSEKWDYIAQGSTAEPSDEGLQALFHMNPEAPLGRPLKKIQ